MKIATFAIAGTAALVVVVFVGTLSVQRNNPSPQPVAESPADPHAPPPAGSTFTGRVVETMDAGGYTYARVDTGEETMWTAGPITPLKVGDTVSFSSGMQMTEFKSETLNRTFDEIYFVSRFLTGESPGTMATHPAPTVTEDLDYSDVDVAAGGRRIAALYAERGDLAGEVVTVRAKVVKFTPNIMQRNWMHLRDGTGAEGANDLAVTTTDYANVGDVVVVRGRLAVDRDFGAGYAYAVIIEDASVSVETVQ